MDDFLDSIKAGWSSKYGSAIYCSGIEEIEFARGFTEEELKELLRENFVALGAVPFHVSLPSLRSSYVRL